MMNFIKLLNNTQIESKHLISREFKKNDTIYEEGEQPQSIYIIEEGVVGLFLISETGKETFLRIFGHGSILGHRSYFAGEAYHATAICLTDCHFKCITKTDFNHIVSRNNELLMNILRLMSQDLGFAEQRLAGLQDKSAPRRICESLLYLKIKGDGQIWTRKQIAEYSGTTTETVARVMTKLEKLSIIQKVKRDYQIIDQEKLLSYN